LRESETRDGGFNSDFDTKRTMTMTMTTHLIPIELDPGAQGVFEVVWLAQLCAVHVTESLRSGRHRREHLGGGLVGELVLGAVPKRLFVPRTLFNHLAIIDAAAKIIIIIIIILRKRKRMRIRMRILLLHH
jgi:hypothetical protein